MRAKTKQPHPALTTPLCASYYTHSPCIHHTLPDTHSHTRKHINGASQVSSSFVEAKQNYSNKHSPPQPNWKGKGVCVCAHTVSEEKRNFLNQRHQSAVQPRYYRKHGKAVTSRGRHHYSFDYRLWSWLKYYAVTGYIARLCVCVRCFCHGYILVSFPASGTKPNAP